MPRSASCSSISAAALASSCPGTVEQARWQWMSGERSGAPIKAASLRLLASLWAQAHQAFFACARRLVRRNFADRSDHRWIGA